MTEQNPDLRIPEPVPDPKPDEAPALDAATTPDPAAQSGEQTFVSAGLPRIPAHFTRAQKLLAFCCPLAGFGVLRYMILHALGLPATLVCWGVLTLGILFLKRTPPDPLHLESPVHGSGAVPVPLAFLHQRQQDDDRAVRTV